MIHGFKAGRLGKLTGVVSSPRFSLESVSCVFFFFFQFAEPNNYTFERAGSIGAFKEFW